MPSQWADPLGVLLHGRETIGAGGETDLVAAVAAGGSDSSEWLCGMAQSSSTGIRGKGRAGGSHTHHPITGWQNFRIKVTSSGEYTFALALLVSSASAVNVGDNFRAPLCEGAVLLSGRAI